MNTTLPAAYAPLLLRNVNIITINHHLSSSTNLYLSSSFSYYFNYLQTKKKKKRGGDEKKKNKKKEERKDNKIKKNCWALTSYPLPCAGNTNCTNTLGILLYKYYSWTHTRIVVKKSMYSSSSDDSDRYSDSDRERTGDDGSISVANKEKSTLLNYEHEYDDYVKDVIGENLGDNDTTSSFSGLHKLSTEKYGKGKKARKVAKKQRKVKRKRLGRVYLSIFSVGKRRWPKYVTLVEPEQGLIMMKNAQK